MLAWFVLAVCVLLGLALAGRWFTSADPKVLAKVLTRVIFGILIAVIVFMAVTGRLAFVFPLIVGAGWWFIRHDLKSMFFRGLQQAFRSAVGVAAAGSTKRGQNQSDVKTDYLHMSLDHDSGEISGEVLRGRFQGAQLTSLTTAEIIELMQECGASDPKSASMLEAYLDKTAPPDWRETWSPGKRHSGQRHNGGNGSASDGPMTRDEALDVLGLSGSPDEAEIKTAHHRMMQKMHPDMGGSTWLATKINEARDLLLNS